MALLHTWASTMNELGGMLTVLGQRQKEGYARIEDPAQTRSVRTRRLRGTSHAAQHVTVKLRRKRSDDRIFRSELEIDRSYSHACFARDVGNRGLAKAIMFDEPSCRH